MRGQYARGLVDGEACRATARSRASRPTPTTETYVALRLRIDNWRWAGTPFYLRTGKRLPKRVTEVAIQFKRVPHAAVPYAAAEQLEPNVLVLRIQPDEGISLRFGAKVPRRGSRSAPSTWTSATAPPSRRRRRRRTRRCCSTRCAATRTLFTRQDEVEESWRIVAAAARRVEAPGAARRTRTRPAPGAPRRPTSCWRATAGAGGGRDRRQPRVDRARAGAACAREEAGEQAGVRTHIVDLVAYADDPVLADEIAAAIAGLRHSRPSRALIACGARERSTRCDAEATVFCSPMQDGGKAHRLLRARAARRAAATATASPAWPRACCCPTCRCSCMWVAPPDFERPVFRALRTLATRLVTDSTPVPARRSTALRRADRAGPRGGDRPGVDEDHGLARGGGARSSTTPATRDALPSSSASRSHYVGGSDAQARLLGGWLVASTGRDAVVKTHRPVERADMRAGSLDARRARLRRPALHRRPAAGGHGGHRRARPGDAPRGAAGAADAGPGRRGAGVSHQRPRFSCRFGRHRGAGRLSSDHARDVAFRGVPRARAGDPGGCRPVHGVGAADRRSGRRQHAEGALRPARVRRLPRPDGLARARDLLRRRARACRRTIPTRTTG